MTAKRQSNLGGAALEPELTCSKHPHRVLSLAQFHFIPPPPGLPLEHHYKLFYCAVLRRP
jgi:hypothetical protein